MDESDEDKTGLARLQKAAAIRLSSARGRHYVLMDGWSQQEAKYLFVDLDPYKYARLQTEAATGLRRAQEMLRLVNEALWRTPAYHAVGRMLDRAVDMGRLTFPAAPQAVMAWAAEKELTGYCPTLTTSWNSMPPLSRGTEVQGGWPWGSHETPLLRQLADAARQFWSTYDPDDPSTAPTNADVATYLKGKGVADRVAEVMAQILRADGLRPGPR
jgi:hypothetical protein